MSLMDGDGHRNHDRSTTMSKQGLGHIPVQPAVVVEKVAAVSYVPLGKLTIGCAYALEARNIGVGIWDGHDFHGIRYKMGSLFMDAETHWDLDDRHGTAKALRKLE